MKTIPLVVLLFSIFCQTALKAQMTKEKINQQLAGKDWKIVRYETFGVEEEPNDTQRNDMLRLNNDMTFLIIENGTEYSGVWSVTEMYITCKSKNGVWQKSYKVISVEEKTATIEYKDPDLTRTLYRMELK